MSEPSGWDRVNWAEVAGSALVSLGVGVIKLLTLVREKRKVRWVDVVLEPSLAVFAGMLMWAVTEATNVPELVQVVMTSLGAYGGPRTLHRLEQKYFGGSREGD